MLLLLSITVTTIDTLIDAAHTDDLSLSNADVRDGITDWFETYDGTVYPKNRLGLAAQETLPDDTDNENESTDTADLTTPDLLVTIDGDVVVVTVADGDSYGAVFDAAYDLFSLWDAYHAHNVSHQPEGLDCEPDYFTVATQYSPLGHVFASGNEFFYKNRFKTQPSIRTPQFEANQSAVAFRILWRFACGQHNADVSAGLGLLLSGTLDGFDDFDDTADDYGMCRAADIETVGVPAVQYWAGDQYWDHLTTPLDTDSANDTTLDTYTNTDT